MPKRPIRAEDLLAMHFLGDAQISPDGRRLLFAKRHVNEKNKYVTNLYSVDVPGADAPAAAKAGSLRQWTQGEAGVGLGRWSPDGRRIAFVSGREKPSAQVFVIDTDGGEARKLTSFPEGAIGSLLWSPDGTKIAVTFRETHPNWTEKAKKEREEKGLSTPPWEIDTLWYRLDGDGYFGGQRYAVYVVDVATGAHSLLYDKDPLGSYSFDWLRDSSGLVVAHSDNKDPLLEKPNDQLFLVPLKGKAKRIKCDTKGSKGSPKVSPDGKWVAYLGSDAPDDPWGVHNTRLWLLPVEGGEARCLTAEHDFCLDVLVLSDTLFGFVADGGGSGLVQWSPDGERVYVSVGWHGAVNLAAVSVADGSLAWVTQGRHLAMGSNLNADGTRMAALWGDATHLLEAAWIDLSGAPSSFLRDDRPRGKEEGGGGGDSHRPRVLTSFNGELLGSLKLSAPEEVWLESTDGARVQAWVMAPIGFNEKKKHPAVLEIHGGPHGQYGWAFFHEFQLLAAQGHFVVFSNPRGSKGYGEAFCAAIRGNWGDKDWDDVQAVTRWMQHHPHVHPGRMGVMGGSYGGYMTNWVVSHTDAFRAAITDRCVFNWLSAGGNSDFPLNKDGYFGGQAWGDHAAIKPVWEQSPIAHFDRVKTPMLVIHSEGDLRCNVEQSDQVFFVLKSKGIEARYVRYPASTSHGMSRNGPPDLRLHRLGEIVAWWEKWLG